MNNKGFTLIELLAVMVILLSIGSIIAAILFSSLQGSTKSNTVNTVRQNGYFALTQMATMIRQATRLDGVSTDGVNYITDCSTSPTQYKYIKIISSDNGQATFSCSKINTVDTIASQSGILTPISLLDTASVSVVSCSITCTRNTSGELPIIGIQFTLSQYTPTGITPFPEKTATIPFQTSVILRNGK